METKNLGKQMLLKHGYDHESLSLVIEELSEGTLDEFKTKIQKMPEINRMIMYFFACSGYDSVKKLFKEKIQSKLELEGQEKAEKKLMFDIRQTEDVTIEGQRIPFKKIRVFKTTDVITGIEKTHMLIGKPYMKEKKQSFGYTILICKEDTPNAFSYCENEYVNFGF